MKPMPGVLANAVLVLAAAAANGQAVSISPSPLVFSPSAAGENWQSMVTVDNTGTAPLTFTPGTPFTITGVSPDAFTYYPNGGCTITYLEFAVSMPAGNTCTITVEFIPGHAGVYAATLNVADNAANSPQTVPVIGIGAAGELQFAPGEFNIVAGTVGKEGDTGNGGPASAALIGGGFGAAFDNNGNFYFSDYYNNTIWKIDTSGNITDFAGVPGTGGYGGDAGPATQALLNHPEQIAFDGYGNMYIADRGNNIVRMVNAASGIITTFAGSYGNGYGGYAGDGGAATAATLNSPLGVAVDPQGNVYIADWSNNVIRVVDTSGKINLFAGTPGVSGAGGDGGLATATGATLDEPYQVATDLAGNVYIADFEGGGSTGRVRWVNTSGIINTYAGGGTATVTTTPQPATGVAIGVTGVATDPAGDVYIAGLGFAYVVNTSQQISVIAGGGSTAPVSGVPAYMANPGVQALAVDQYGDVFINDATNHLIEEVGPDGDLVFPNTAVNSTSAPMTVTLTNTGNATLSFANQNDQDEAKAGIQHSVKDHGASPDVVDFSSYGTITGPFAIATGGSCNFDNGIAAGASCTMNVTFSPTSPGPQQGTVVLYTITPENYDYANTVLLSGNGSQASSAPAVTLVPPSLSFPSTASGTTSMSMSTVLTNSGNAPLTITATALIGANPGDFIESDNCVSASPLAANGTCTISVQFAPAAAAAYSASVSITDNASNSPQSVPLSGTGTAPPAPVVSLTPASLTFTANTGTTTAAQTATLNNTGNAPLTITGITIAGANLADFSQTNNCGTALAVESNCTISITFTPASAANFAATLTVTDNASGSPQTTALTGTGTAPPDFSISATPPSQTIASNGSALYTVTVASSEGNFSNPVGLTVTGLPAGATGSFSPTSINPGDGSGTSTLTVQTAKNQLAQSRSGMWPLATPAFVLLILFPFRRWRRVRAGRLLLLVAGLASLGAAAALTGCGGGFALNVSQTYTLTVTGTSGSDTHSTTVQLTVQ